MFASKSLTSVSAASGGKVGSGVQVSSGVGVRVNVKEGRDVTVAVRVGIADGLAVAVIMVGVVGDFADKDGETRGVVCST